MTRSLSRDLVLNVTARSNLGAIMAKEVKSAEESAKVFEQALAREEAAQKRLEREATRAAHEIEQATARRHQSTSPTCASTRPPASARTTSCAGRPTAASRTHRVGTGRGACTGDDQPRAATRTALQPGRLLLLTAQTWVDLMDLPRNPSLSGDAS